MRIVEQYLAQLNIEKRRWRRAAAILTVLSLFVATGVAWNLRMTGITIANDANCGMEEHRHSAACGIEMVLICGYDEEIPTQDPAEIPTDPPIELPPEEPLEEEILPEESPLEEIVEEEVSPEELPIEEEAVEEEIFEEDPIEETPAEETEEESLPDGFMQAVKNVFSGLILNANAGDFPVDFPERHVHTEDCYEIRYLCEMEEHIHRLSCHSDDTADIELSVMWEADLPELNEEREDWAEDLVSIAQSQLGNGESERNYIVEDDEETRKGITRYGQWYGNPYGDWSAMFVQFCLHYAEIPEDALPHSPGVYNMMRLAEDEEILLLPDEGMTNSGNLLFLDTDDNGKADRMAIVTDFTEYDEMTGEEAFLTAIAGDWEDMVAEIELEVDDPMILGYIDIRQVQEAWEAENAPEVIEPPVEEQLSAAPSITLDIEIPEEEEPTTFRLTAEISNIEPDLYLWQWQVSEDGNEPWTDMEDAYDLFLDLEATEENFNRYYRLRGEKAPIMQTFALRAGETEEEAEEETEELPEDYDTIISEPIAPFSIGKNNNTYTIDVYTIPVDEAGNRISVIPMTTLTDITVNSDTKIQVAGRFNSDLGQFQSAYFGTETNVQVDNIQSVWRTSSGWLRPTYYLAYQQTNGTSVTQWKSSADSSISLYLRYIPQFTVTFASEGFTPLSEKVTYNGFLTMDEPAWTKDGYTLIGWTADDNEQTVYTFDEIKQKPVTANATYTAKWANQVTVSFDLGEHADALYPIDSMEVSYGSSPESLPTPTWRYNAVAMAFDGWYLDAELNQAVTGDYRFYTDTTLYAKWSPKEDGYYVYFMDFEKEGEVPLVVMTYSVTEGHTVSPYIPTNPPDGTRWNGKWYLEVDCINAYNFSIPVSSMTDYLTGAHGRDLYLYPGAEGVVRAIFVTYGTRVDPITMPIGGTVNLDQYKPERPGFTFAGWTLQDGTPVSGVQTLHETTTFVAQWNADYVPFEAIRRIENANDTGMTQADILGTWYAKAGSQIKVKSTYSGSGDSRKGTHEVVCVLDGVEYPVYTNAGLTQKATLADVYATYFLYNNTGTTWTDEVNWDDVYTGGEVPYSTRPISSAGDTIINFDYMRVRTDIVFTIPNNNNTTTRGGYIDVYKLYRDGLITGSVTYTGTKPTSTGKNVSATGVSAQNIRWTYTAASQNASSGNNYYTLHDMKYGQRVYEVYPVGASWLTPRNSTYQFHQYGVDGGALFASRRQDLTADFFQGSGRAVVARSLTAQFKNQEFIALMYAIECLEGEKADFTLNGVDYKVNAELCEVVKHTGDFSIKALDGCEPGISANGTYKNGSYTYNKYYSAKISSNTTSATVMSSAKVGNTSVLTLFSQTYWPHYDKFNGIDKIEDIHRAYIFYYDRLRMDIQFNFGYDATGDGVNETIKYEGIAYGERIDEYQFGAPDYEQHDLLDRPGYEFVGWMDANGFVLEEADWKSLVAEGDSEDNTMVFIAKWEKISDNIVEYYEDRSSTTPFESHYFDDGELVPYPTMPVEPEGWVWKEYGEDPFRRFDWDVPMYGEYGVRETRTIDGEERVVNVIRIYGTWDESHTKVIYDPNPPQGGIPDTAPLDPNEYTIWQSAVPVAARGDTANADPDMVFVGWQLDRNGVVYHPGDHVPVQWPRVMKFVAQWAKPTEVVHLRYDSNGGTPEAIYPNDQGFPYKRNATAAVWDNTWPDGQTAHFTRPGYRFTGWNTEPNGSGTAYAPDSTIVLTASVTTLYAQWEPTTYTLSLHKVDREDSTITLSGAKFGLYRQEGGKYLLLHTLTTGDDGHITFLNLEVDTLYKLVEETPPNGYAMLNKEIFFKLQPIENGIFLRYYDAEGNEINEPGSVSGEYITGNQLLNLTVQNIRGYELPSTGGTGILFNILCGVPLVAAPLVYGFRLRRRHERRFKH